MHHKIQIQKKKNQQVDPEIWIAGVTDANAYYNPMDNSINIIGGILGAPFYMEDMTLEEKLGGIGMIIGHEISHAFDSTGSQFDADGNMVNWWTEEDQTAFSERTGKVAAWFDQVIPYEGGTYSGIIVQNEAIADMAGVKCMLRIAQDEENFDYDVFFRSVADIWRNASTKEMIQMQASMDSHPLAYLRVNATVMQFPEFYQTYEVKEGDGMYLAEENRFSVW